MAQLTDITSVELDRSKPFKHVIRLKNGDTTLEVIPVTETQGDAMLQKITKAWWDAIKDT